MTSWRSLSHILPIHWSLAGLTLLSLACGGSGSSSSNSKESASQAGSVTVIPPSISSSNYWVAYQDDDGPWQVAAPSGSSYTFNVTNAAGRYGVVLVDEASALVYGSILHLTRKEASRVDFSNQVAYATTTDSGSVAGLSSADTGTVMLRRRGWQLPAGATSYSLSRVPPVASDLLAIRKAGGGPADRMVTLRNYSHTGPSIPGIDFNQGWSLSPQSLSVGGTLDSGETLTTYASWITPTTSIMLASASGSALAFNAVPPAYQAAGEIHAAGGYAANYTTGTRRYAVAYSKSAQGISLTLPPQANVPSFGSAGTTPYFRPTLSWRPLPNTLNTYIWADDTTSNNMQWDFSVSAGWLAGNAAPTYTFPDLTALQGWKNTWGFVPGHTLSWSYSNRWSSAPDQGFYTLGVRSFAEGSTYWSSYVTGSLTASAAPAAQPLQAMMGAPLPSSFHGRSIKTPELDF